MLIDRRAKELQVGAKHRLPRSVDGLDVPWCDKGEERGDDRHHHEEFDQRETTNALHSFHH
jgi:hypothetical protein